MKLNLSKAWYEELGSEDEFRSVTAGIPYRENTDPDSMQMKRMAQQSKNHILPFGKLINLLRRARNLSMEDLAEQSYVELVEIYRIEIDHNHPSERRTVVSLAEFLKLSSDKLFQHYDLSSPTNTPIREDPARYSVASTTVEVLTEREGEELRETVRLLRVD